MRCDCFWTGTTSCGTQLTTQTRCGLLSHKAAQYYQYPQIISQYELRSGKSSGWCFASGLKRRSIEDVLATNQLLRSFRHTCRRFAPSGTATGQPHSFSNVVANFGGFGRRRTLSHRCRSPVQDPHRLLALLRFLLGAECNIFRTCKSDFLCNRELHSRSSKDR